MERLIADGQARIQRVSAEYSRRNMLQSGLYLKALSDAHVETIENLARARLAALLAAYDKGGLPLDDKAEAEILTELQPICTPDKIVRAVLHRGSTAGSVPNAERVTRNLAEGRCSSILAALRREVTLLRQERALDASRLTADARHHMTARPTPGVANFVEPPPTSNSLPNAIRFQIALSFPGEQRPRVGKIAELLAATVGKERVLYDHWHRAELARPNLNVYLPRLYHDKSLLLVFFFSRDYANRQWCGLEWRVGLDLLKKKEDDRLMFLRMDDTEIPGLYSGDGYLDIAHLPDEEVAAEILKRLAMIAELPAGALTIMPEETATTGPTAPLNLQKFLEQRVYVPETDIMRKILSKPRWHVWVCPTEFRKARFKNLDDCRRFVDSSRVLSRGFPYPSLTGSTQTGEEWLLGESDKVDGQVQYAERWTIHRSGQFVYHRTFDESPRPEDRIHVLGVLEIITATFEFAARMAKQGVLSPEAMIAFELVGVDGRGLTWPQDTFGYSDAAKQNCWCQDSSLTVSRRVPPATLEAQRRELALDVALEIYSGFGWTDPPRQHLADEQGQKFGAA